MNHGKFAPGAVILNEFIYVAGSSGPQGLSRSCERFNMLKNEWEDLTMAPLPTGMACITLESVKKRYIIAFGGSNSD